MSASPFFSSDYNNFNPTVYIVENTTPVFTTIKNNEMFTPSFNTLISPHTSSGMSATVSKETSNLCLTSPVGSGSAVSSDCNTSEKFTVSTELSLNHSKNAKRNVVEVGVGVSVGGTFAIVTTAALILISVCVCVWWKGRKKKQFSSVVNVAYNRHSGHMTMSVKTSDTAEYECTKYSYSASTNNLCPTTAASDFHTTHDVSHTTEADVTTTHSPTTIAAHVEGVTNNVAYGAVENEVELSTNISYGFQTVGYRVSKDFTYDYVLNRDIITKLYTTD